MAGAKRASYDKAFTKGIEETRKRVEEFLSNDSGGESPDEIIQEVNVMLEELRVADEELRAQNEELTKAKNQAEHDRARYQELFDHAPDGYVVTDLTGRIEEANAAFLEMVDTPTSLVFRKKLLDFVADRSKASFTERLNGLGKQAQEEEWFIRMQSLTRSPFLASLRMNLVWNNRKELVGIRWMIRVVSGKEATAMKSELR